MGRILMAATVAGVVGWAVPAGPVHASAGTSALCTLSFPAEFSPGIGMTPGSGTVASGGETGTITCSGKLNGHRITGPGTFGFEGTYTDSSCVSHRSTGTSGFTIPTDGGPVRIAGGSYSIDGVGLGGRAEATHTEPVSFGFAGSYVLLPQRGTCATDLLTEALVTMTGTMRG